MLSAKIDTPQATAPKNAMSADTTKLELLATSLRDVPDTLVAIELDLKPLCEGKVEGVPAPVKKTLEEACAMLGKSIGRVMTALEYIDEWTEGVGDRRDHRIASLVSTVAARKAPADGSGQRDGSP
jgi:hypothetical protein